MSQRIFINHTNHPSGRWSEGQRETAEAYGEIVDIPFPIISADETEEEISCRVDEMAGKIISMQPEAVLCQGEYNYTFLMVSRLREKGIKVCAACSERIVREWMDDEGRHHKDTVFQFQKFREYGN